MAALYVYALTDEAVDSWNDGRRRIESIPLEGLFAVCERRPASPPISEAELQRQHAIVQRIADSAPATLPARFGSLLDEAELVRMIRNRRDVVQAALDHVRGHVQMTVRIAIEDTRSPALHDTRSPAIHDSRSPALQGCPPVESGRAYLEARQQRASPAVPPRARTALETVAPWVADERRTASAARLLTVYQLVSREHVSKYTAAIAAAAVQGMRVTGPWPPFAFVPDLWG